LAVRMLWSLSLGLHLHRIRVRDAEFGAAD
jgi:hypothetical protein